MPPRDPERFRRQLEKQFRADVEMLYGAYSAKLRAYETMRRLHGEIGEEVDLDLRFLLPEGLPLSLSAAPSPPSAPAPPAPVAPPTAPAPEPRRKSVAHELFKAIVAILDQLPERFEPRDVIVALGYEPRRSSLHRMLKAMVQDGWLVLEERGGGEARQPLPEAPSHEVLSGGGETPEVEVGRNPPPRSFAPLRMTRRGGQRTVGDSKTGSGRELSRAGPAGAGRKSARNALSAAGW